MLENYATSCANNWLVIRLPISDPIPIFRDDMPKCMKGKLRYGLKICTLFSWGGIYQLRWKIYGIGIHNSEALWDVMSTMIIIHFLLITFHSIVSLRQRQVYTPFVSILRVLWRLWANCLIWVCLNYQSLHIFSTKSTS